MRTTTTPRIAFDDVGDREPALLFMPGWCGPRDAFRPLYPYLDRRALAVDWRGHGGSDRVEADFGSGELVTDALAVLAAAGVGRVIPVGLAHAGWVAIELRKRLGPDRVPGVVLVDWMVLGAPPPFADALRALQQASSWTSVRDRLFAMWTTGVESRSVHDYVAKMATQPFEMWARGSREIAAAFAACPVPLDALAPLACPTLHVYAQPADAEFLDAQQRTAATRPWFRVHRVAAASHFPMFETPAEIAVVLENFARELG